MTYVSVTAQLFSLSACDIAADRPALKDTEDPVRLNVQTEALNGIVFLTTSKHQASRSLQTVRNKPG